MLTTRITLHDAELRQSYMDGTNYIIKQLPRPKVANYFGHSYVSIKMCIADYLETCYLPSKNLSNDNRIIKSISDSIF